ncbi:integrase/recombinase, partial [mine drainage metagenome]
MRAAGHPWRPYVLRAYFDTQLLLAESKGKVAHDYRVFMMGHRGSMEARYTTDKQRLPGDLVDDMREAYGRCEPFLGTAPTPEGEAGGERVLKLWLQAGGMTEAEISKMDLAEIPDEDLLKLLRERLKGKA